MDFDQLQSFLAVSRCLSFTLAAQERGLTQPGLSRQIQRLERDLGIELFDRKPGALSLTPVGERFYAYAEEAVKQHVQILGELRAVTRELAGDLRIIASTTPGAYLVPSLVAQFQAQHPSVHPEVAITDSAAVIAAVGHDRWDVGFTGAAVTDPHLQSRIVADDEIVLAVPVHLPLAQRQEVFLADLADLPFLDREEGSGTLRSVRAVLARQHRTLPPRRVVMVLSSCQAIIAAVRQGLGVGFVSTLALDRVTTADVVGVRLGDVAFHRHLYLVYDRQRPLAPVPKAFIGFVEQRTHHQQKGNGNGRDRSAAGRPEASPGVRS